MEEKKTKKPYKHLFFIRLIVGIIFLFFGIMHLINPENFQNILRASDTPLVPFNLVFVPIAEIVVGALLLLGLISRIAGIIGFIIMVIGAWTTLILMHLDPSQLPDDLTQKPFYPPIFIPIVLALLCLYITIFGCGAWGIDSHRKGKKEG
ncbi:MAG: DoxX family protein [Simkaniaceae bacterium]